MYYSIKYIILANLFGFVFSSAIIKGIVYDNNTDAPLIGANIIVDGGITLKIHENDDTGAN